MLYFNFGTINLFLKQISILFFNFFLSTYKKNIQINYKFQKSVNQQTYMLGFTNQSQGFKTTNNYNKNLYQPSFQPIIITNKQPKITSPKKQQKAIKKVLELENNRNQSKKNTFYNYNEKQSYSKGNSKGKPSTQNKNQWNVGGIVKGAFDKRLKRDELAAQQRKIRAQIKKQKLIMHTQIIVNEKKIGDKAIKMGREKDREIQELQMLIEKEKQQKAKIDKMYEQKKREIEKQREELMELQRKIQKEGLKEKKIIQKIQRVGNAQQDNFNSRNLQKGPVSSKNINMMRSDNRLSNQQRFQQPTQSQNLHQKNALRQKQLQYLITQRQKTLQGIPNINYTPSLIPLLSKASYKIISTHVSQIVQLLIDDLLEQQVYNLQEIELKQAKIKEQRKQKQLLNEYYTMLDNFVDQNQQISNKVGRYSTMNFTDLYKPKNYPLSSKNQESFEQPSKLVRKINLQHIFDQDRIQQIQNKKDRFIRFVSNFDQYKKPNIQMFQKCTQQIINQAIEKLALELDKGSKQFVDIVFRNQFN